MPRTLLIALVAIAAGFVSILVYRVSAADTAGTLQLAHAAQSTIAEQTDPSVAIEFIVRQCQPGGSLEPPSTRPADRARHAAAMTEPSPAEIDTAMPTISAPVSPVPADRPGLPKGVAIEISPSILFLP